MANEVILSSITLDDLIEEYKILHDGHRQLKEKSEADTQRIYELKRSLDTAHAAEAYLTQELEQLSASSQTNNGGSDADSKAQQELEELRRKHKQIQCDYESLQHDYEAKKAAADELKVQLAAVERKYAEDNALAAAAATHVDCLERFATLEADNMELLEKLEQCQNSGVQHTFEVAEKEKTIEILRDQVSCLTENLRGKRDEVEEKTQMLESAQEQLVDANAKIAALSAAPENERKGNSLFAEVDDQRQAMKKLLAAQKKSYLQMKKSYNDSEYEIRRLKRENIAMHTELHTCSTIFCNADRTYKDKLNERIRQLLNQQEMLERKLQWTQERLRDMACEKAVDWLDSMLKFCKQETEEYKKQLYSVRIQKASTEEQLRNARQELARWRFESLKSRCVLIDRENLLTEHKISFKPKTALEFDITEAQQQAARPRIHSVEKKERTSLTPQDLPTLLPASQQVATVCQAQPTDCKVEMPVSIESIKTEPLEAAADATDLPHTTHTIAALHIKTELDADEDDLFVTAKPPKTYRPPTPMKPKPGKVTSKIEEMPPEEATLAVVNRSPLQPLAGSPLRPNLRSILTKSRDIFAEDAKKNVQFSTEAPTVHNLSVVESKENRATDASHVRPKSKVIVKRIVVGSLKQERS